MSIFSKIQELIFKAINFSDTKVSSKAREGVKESNTYYTPVIIKDSEAMMRFVTHTKDTLAGKEVIKTYDVKTKKKKVIPRETSTLKDRERSMSKTNNLKNRVNSFKEDVKLLWPDGFESNNDDTFFIAAQADPLIDKINTLMQDESKRGAVYKVLAGKISKILSKQNQDFSLQSHRAIAWA